MSLFNDPEVELFFTIPLIDIFYPNKKSLPIVCDRCDPLFSKKKIAYFNYEKIIIIF